MLSFSDKIWKQQDNDGQLINLEQYIFSEMLRSCMAWNGPYTVPLLHDKLCIYKMRHDWHAHETQSFNILVPSFFF